MHTLKSCLWRQIASLIPIYRGTRQNTVKSVIAPLRTELLSDYMLRDLGLPRRDADLRLPRL